MKKKYYAVRKGRTTGLFYHWITCSQSVLGYPNAEYKSFKTKKEAEEYLKGNEHDKKGREPASAPPAQDSLLLKESKPKDNKAKKKETSSSSSKEQAVLVGKWIWDENRKKPFCSNCKVVALKKPSTSSTSYYKTDYCYNCGAKMTGIWD